MFTRFYMLHGTKLYTKPSQ
jgi:hypothetical protein